MFFQQVSLVGFVANLLAIPLVTLAITPLALLGVSAAAAVERGGLAGAGLVLLLGWLAAWPLGVWSAAAAPPWAVAAGLLGGLLR